LAGYSGTPLAKKLGIREGHLVAWLGAPTTFAPLLGELPLGAKVRKSARVAHSLDVIVLFAKAMSDLTKRLPRAAKTLAYDGGLWIAWPKRASGIETDVGESVVRTAGLGVGLVDNKVCAIDETWSGLRFVHRVNDRRKK
jgi:Protein of unknown function (DUF3052)